MTRRTLDLLYLAAGYLAGLFLVGIFVLMMLLSLGREVNLNVPSGDDFTAWSLAADDFVSWCMAAMAFLGLAHTFRKGEMIRVGLLLERLHGRPRRIAELVSLTIAAAFIAYFTWQAGKLAYDSWQFFDMSTGVVSVPLWIPQSGMVLGLAILLIAIAEEWVTVARGGRPTYEPEPPKTTEELIERVAQGGGV